MSNIYAMEETDKGNDVNGIKRTTNVELSNQENNIINTNSINHIDNVNISNKDDNIIDTSNTIANVLLDNNKADNINTIFKADRENISACQLANVIPEDNIHEEIQSKYYNDINLKDYFNTHEMQESFNKIIQDSIKELHNSALYKSINNKKYNSITNNNKHLTDYKKQKPVELSIIKDKKYNQDYEKFLFSIDDTDVIDNYEEAQDNINFTINNSVLYGNSENKVECLYNAMINYYNNNASENSKYETRKTYIPFIILQMIYNSIKKYGEDIAQQVINKLYNSNTDTVNDYFKEIYNKKEFDSEENKRNKGFLGTYSINKVPTNKELEINKGKALADYWEYANRSDKMFPSINVQYTDEYLKESHRRWQNDIKHKLNNIIEKSSKNKPIDNIINYYSKVANRAPNIYLSNDVIDFINNKLGRNDVIYFIDKFINIKQQYMTEDDLPHNPEHFPNIFNEYPNGNLKDYKVNVYDPNCVVCIFNSSDKYGDGAIANRIIIDNNKEKLYNRLVDANATFNPPRWRINKYSKVNNENNKEYKTVFLYYTK